MDQPQIDQLLGAYQAGMAAGNVATTTTIGNVLKIMGSYSVAPVQGTEKAVETSPCPMDATPGQPSTAETQSPPQSSKATKRATLAVEAQKAAERQEAKAAQASSPKKKMASKPSSKQTQPRKKPTKTAADVPKMEVGFKPGRTERVKFE